MIINELCNYYEILKESPNSEIPTLGYSIAKVSACLVLSKTGELVDIIPLLEIDKKRKIPQNLLVPLQNGRSGKNPPPYFMCDNIKYVLGMDTNRNICKNQFEAFKEYHNKMLAGIEDNDVIAFLAFLNNFHIEKTNPIIENNLETLLVDKNLVFKIDGQPKYLHQNTKIDKIWNENCIQTDDKIGQCMITGETTTIKRIHTQLKGIRGAQSSGAALVGFNAPSYESYGKTQSLNAPVGNLSEFAYTTVLNHMLRSNDQKIQIGDTTTVFWAQSDNAKYANIVMGLFNYSTDEETSEDTETENLVKDILKKMKDGMPLNKCAIDIDTHTKFCILGLSPNAARISVRFFIVNSFDFFVDKLTQHYKDMEMVKSSEKDFTSIPIWAILRETISPKSTDKTPKPLLSGSLMRAMLSGSMYPEILYQSILMRIKNDSDIRVNYTRASILKLYLTRKAKITNNQYLKEVLTMALNEETKDVAYLLGRLFAVLEKTQLEAIGNVNSSIKDKYFTSASTTPKMVFPILLRLAQHHISKAKFGYKMDKHIETILNDIGEFPAHLNLDQQGLFSIGYYHQRVKLWQKAEKTENIENAEV